MIRLDTSMIHLDISCWTLDVGRWMLDVGCWMSDVGCWLVLVASDKKHALLFQYKGKSLSKNTYIVQTNKYA